MILETQEFGTPNARPLVLVHGLMGQGKNLASIARAMADGHYVITVDMRNHGASPWDVRNDYDAMAMDLSETFAQYAQIDIMGHSMGGKAAMYLALSQPEFVNQLLVADIAPVTYSHDHRDDLRALLALDLAKFTRRSEIDQALITAIPDAAARAFYLHGLELKPEPRWVNNLAVLINDMDKITGWPAVHGQYHGRTLFLRGGNSPYVTDNAKAPISAYFPNAETTTIDGAGHWLHAEKPKLFINALEEFFHA